MRGWHCGKDFPEQSTRGKSEQEDRRLRSNEEDDDDSDEFKEGKDPMSPELYHSICKWLLEWGTLEGIFGALFIVELGISRQ
jgi:hypothetical protein